MKKQLDNSIQKLTISQIIGLHVVLLLLKILWVTNWSLELHYEEAQYWLWSKHLDWSYYSKPGMVAWMNYLSTGIFGNTELGVKFPAIVAGFVTSLAIYYSAHYLFKDKKIALFSSLMLYMMPFYYSISLFHSTDSFLVAFGAVSFYYFIKALNENKSKDWLLLGVFLGLASLSKFTGLLIALTYFIYLLIYNRPLIPKLLMASLVMFVVLLPVLIWNIQNDFVSFKHVTKLASKEKEYSLWRLLNGFLEYVGGQLAIISPFLFFFLIKSGFKWNKKLWFTAFPAIVSFGVYFFILLNKGEAPNVNWAFFNYAPLAIFFTVVLLQAKRMNWLVPVAFLLGFFFWIISNTEHLDTIGLGKAVPPTSDPTYIYHRWKEPAHELANMKELDGSMIFSNDYKLISSFEFYMHGAKHLVYLGSGNRRNQLSYWNEVATLDTKDKIVYFLGTRKEFPEQLSPQFGEVELMKTLPAHWRGEEIKTYYLFRAKAVEQLHTIVDGY